MIVIPILGWVFYCKDESVFLDKNDKVGKWMYFFSDVDFAAEMCKKAVEENVVSQAKHVDDETGVACFYLNCDDEEEHKKVITFFMENKLVPITKSGKLKNISFKLNSQTRAGEYGNGYKAMVKLEDFIDLRTGKWIR